MCRRVKKIECIYYGKLNFFLNCRQNAEILAEEPP